MRRLAVLVLTLPAAACADAFAPEPAEPLPTESPPPTPVVRLTTSTSGPGSPSYIYHVGFDNGNYAWALPGKPADFYAASGDLRLTGLAPGCAAAGNPRTVPIAGDTVHVHFDITCQAPPPPVAAVGEFLVDDEYLVGFDSLGRSARVLGIGRSPAWRPDGELLAFIGGTGAARGVMVLDPATGSTLGVGGTFASEYPEGRLLAWHPDGDRVAFGVGTGLRLLTVLGGEQVTLQPGLGAIRNVDWSPSGDSLVVSSDSGIALVAADGSGRRVLADSRAHLDASPSWSPAGEWVAIARIYIPYPVCPCGPGIGFGFPFFGSHATHTAGNQLVLARTDGSMPHQILETSVGGGFAWSPNGSRLAYTGPEWTVHIATPDNAVPTSLGVRGVPSWAASGELRVHGDEGVYLFQADGSGRTTVVGAEDESMFRYMGGPAVWR